jgi:hypothetical protein
MKNILLTLMVVGIIGCSDRSQDNSTELPEPYMFATSENTYVIEEHCLLQNAQQCKTENCNDFIQEFCLSQGQPYDTEMIPKDVLMFEFPNLNSIFDVDGRMIVPPRRSSEGENKEVVDLYMKTLKDQNRAKKIISDALANEYYKNIYECKLMESQKCKTNKCSDFVSGYCERFTYFKGEKLIAENLRVERYKQERAKIYSRINLILSNPDSYPATEVAESFCFGITNKTYFHRGVDALDAKLSCEEWFLMDDMQRKEMKLPLETDYRWNFNPSNPDRTMLNDQVNMMFNAGMFLDD